MRSPRRPAPWPPRSAAPAWRRRPWLWAASLAGLPALALAAPDSPPATGERALWALSLALLGGGLGWLHRRQGRALEAARRAGRRAVDALEGAGEGLWDWDIATGTVYYSDGWKTMLGHAPEEVGNGLDEWQSRVHPADLPATLELIEAHLQGHTASYRSKHRLRCKDGSYRWILDRGRVVERDAEGHPLRMTGTHSDTTAQHEAEEELRASEATLRSLLAALGEGVLMRDTGGRTLLANAAAARLLNLSEAELDHFDQPGSPLRTVREDGTPCPPEALSCNRVLADGQPHSGVVGIELPEGRRRWLLSRSEPVYAGQPPRLTAVVSSLSDITRLRETEEELRLADKVFANSVESIVITGADQRILRVNPAFTAVTGYRPEEVIGRYPSILRSGRHDAAFFRAMRDAIENQGFWQGEIWNRRKDGKIIPQWLSVSAVRDGQGRLTHYVGVFTDITERKAQEARIAFLAHHDPLTALPNRSLMVERLERRTLRSQRDRSRFALLFLDLDHFKHINDSLGHAVGDKLLKEIAGRLTHCVRSSDSVGRLGGDEFLILLAELADAADAGNVAEKIIEQMAPPFELEGHRLSTSISIGIAIYPGDGKDSDTLMKNADTAMYHAKAGGRNTFRFFTEAMNAAAMERLMLDNAMRQALERVEFRLVYQPQVCLASGRITGMEALLRWKSGEYGEVPPSRFIPLAEDNGQIIPIGRWALEQACRDASTWGQGPAGPVPVAVNLSALQFRRDDVVALVLDTLSRTGLPPAMLELELTESLLLEQGTEALETIRRLKAEGIRIAIDDFGTGYSSLSYIKRFRVDRLKVDQSFIRDLDSDPEDAEIVRAIIQLGHSLRMEVVAEGVETPRQLTFLQAEGCEFAQGYLFARPRPAAEAFWDVGTHHVVDGLRRAAPQGGPCEDGGGI
jgi:diguanylate cyclase (GGDEF)-like protein/PAS domain S-box-containing protein